MALANNAVVHIYEKRQRYCSSYLKEESQNEPVTSSSVLVKLLVL